MIIGKNFGSITNLMGKAISPIALCSTCLCQRQGNPAIYPSRPNVRGVSIKGRLPLTLSQPGAKG